jgi:class 3 adenylate cyclase
MSDVATRAPRSAGRAPLWGALDVGQRPGDDPDLRVRKRTAVAVVYALVVAGLVYAALAIAADRPWVLFFSLAQISAQLIILAWFHRTGHLRAVVVAIIVIGMTTIASGVVTLGGIQESNGNIIFAVITPVGAVLLLGRRAAVPAFILFVALVLWATLTDPLWRDFTSPVPEGMGLGLYAVNLLLTCGITLAMVVFIDGERVAAKARSETLLLNVLPAAIVERLQGGEQVIADHCPEVTVLFSDVVDFTPFSERVEPQRVVQVLDDLFSAFDALAERYGLEKIKTIGDAYMVVAGVPRARPDHAEVMLEMAIAMHRATDDQSPLDDHRLQIRTGIATGPVVAGVIGRRKFSYDLWGDTVNTASRMESSGVPGCIQVTEATWERVRDRYAFQVREGVEVKGKGPMTTHLLDPSALATR